jgi:glycosyltransferase involved in cell wall biosynthesis
LGVFQLKICVLNPGVVHAVPRTIAFSRYFDEVHYIDLKGRDSRNLLERNGIIYHAPFYDGRDRLGSYRLQRLFRRIAPDGIVCHFAYGGHYFNSILYNRCPVAVIAMGSDILHEGDGYMSPLSKLLIRMGLRRSEYISAKSIHLRERIHSYQTKATVDVNYWGADLSFFQPGDKNTSRKKLGIPPDIPVVLSPRAVQPLYNIDLIVESVIALKRNYPDVRLVVLGRTQDEYRIKIEKFIEKNRIGQNVNLIYEVEQNVLIDYYIAADVIVSMARTDGFPNTVLEALACKRPVVIGRIPHIEELIQDGCGAKVTNINVHEIAESIIDVIKNNSKYIEMVNMGYAIVKQSGDIKVNGEKFASAFKEVIQRRGKIKRSPWDILPFWCVFVAHALHRQLLRV